MKVFCDYHHRDLINSMCHLFEKRVGAELYVPWGIEYYTNGYWHVVDSGIENVSKQFLCDIFNQTNSQDTIQKESGIVEIKTNDGKLPFKGMTLDTFRNTKFDILISTLPGNIDSMMKLKNEYQPSAKFILEVGNNWGSVWKDVSNLLNSTTQTYIGGTDMRNPTSVSLYYLLDKADLYKGYFKRFKNKVTNKQCNMVYFHPEFDLNIFKLDNTNKNPYSIANLRHLCDTTEVFNKIESYLPNWECKMYGLNNRDGELKTDYEIANTINKFGFIYHVKPHGDGYGYNIHQTYAQGSVLITDSSYMCSGGNKNEWFTCQLLFDIEHYDTNPTFVDVSGYDYTKIINRIKYISENYYDVQKNIIHQFKKVVDFDYEYENYIKVFLENLL